MAVRERLNFVEPNGRKFSKTAVGADAATATTYAAAIAKITVGTLASATQTSDVAVLPGVNAGPDYSDATFHFRKGTDNANVHFEQLANAYAEVIDGNPTGNVDIGNADIDDYATAWSTANGGGWSLVEGHYVK